MSLKEDLKTLGPIYMVSIPQCYGRGSLLNSYLFTVAPPPPRPRPRPHPHPRPSSYPPPDYKWGQTTPKMGRYPIGVFFQDGGLQAHKGFWIER